MELIGALLQLFAGVVQPLTDEGVRAAEPPPAIERPAPEAAAPPLIREGGP